MNQYITDNKPNENLIYVLDYLGIDLQEFLNMSDDKLVSIYKKSADALNDGSFDKGTKPHKIFSKVEKYEGYGNITHKNGEIVNFGDSGSKSRYFDIDVWAEKHGLLQFPKASKKERNEGCEGLEEKNNMRVNAPRENEEEKHATLMKNHHPTVKPVHLMSWLVRLVSKEGDTVLDPFMGSGTTGVACKILNRNFIGIELSAEYCAIGKARMDAAKQTQPNLFDEKV